MPNLVAREFDFCIVEGGEIIPKITAVDLQSKENR
jgi:hypothetical protein